MASRFSNVGTVIEEELFSELVQLSTQDELRMPEWLSELLGALGYRKPKPRSLNDVILVREPSTFNFGKASYEITEACNYKCRHCYLDRKSDKTLSVANRKKILRLIERSGCLWLQITGGEPFACKDFAETYSFAHSLGFLITLSTNGSLLTKPHIAKILSSYPPYRLTISLYGATADSYETLTRTQGSFQQFLRGLEWAKQSGVRTRLNIIVTRYNEAEKSAMINLAESFGFEYRIFPRLSPTLEGNSVPLGIMGQDCEDIRKDARSSIGNSRYVECMAGRTFFHVDSIGRGSICKIAREPNVNLLDDGIEGFSKLPGIAEQLLRPPFLCKSCTLRNSCNTCPPRLALYQRSEVVPLYVCNRLSDVTNMSTRR